VLSATNQPDPLAQPVAGARVAPEAEANELSVVPCPTPLSAALGLGMVETAQHCGAQTPRILDALPEEIDALLHTAGVSDLGWRAKILVTGSDRLRWLNGMVSNTVQALAEGEGNYSFLLSV